MLNLNHIFVAAQKTRDPDRAGIKVVRAETEKRNEFQSFLVEIRNKIDINFVSEVVFHLNFLVELLTIST